MPGSDRVPAIPIARGKLQVGLGLTVRDAHLRHDVRKRFLKSFMICKA